MRFLHWLMVLVAGGLLVAALASAAQELVRHQDARARASLTGEAPSMDPLFREAWRLPLFVLVLGVDLLGSVVALRVLLRPALRGVSRRLVGVLLVGLAAADVAYLVDARWLFQAPYLGRALGVLALYPVAAFLVTGATIRLGELEAAFAPRR